jgi:predicted deacylase
MPPTPAVRVEALARLTRHDLNVVVDAPGAARTAIPVSVLVGRSHRPRVALVAGVHGDEYDGIVALQALLHRVAAGALAGALLVIPVANPLAFAAATRHTPHDDHDLNRVFPGCAAGAPTERLAAALCDDILADVDLVMTLHGARATGVLMPWIEFADYAGAVGRRSFEAARASGFGDLVALPRLPGRLMTAMVDRGVPLIEAELGGRGALAPGNVERYLQHVAAVARHTGVWPDASATPPAGGLPRIWHLHALDAGTQGMLVGEVELGQQVRRGNRLGRLLTITGSVAEVIEAPIDGVVAGMRTHAGVAKGDHLFSMWSAATASVAGFG